MVFETLFDSFDTFKLNYSMNKLSYNFTELMKELQTAKTLFSNEKNRRGEAHSSINRASTSRTKRFRPNMSRKDSKPSHRPNKPLMVKVN